MFRQLLLAVVCLGVSTGAFAGEAVPTAITVKKMCPSCAKKINQRLMKVGGVAAATNDLERKAYTATPTAGTVLSPRELWEAVEAGGEVPVRLSGPSGTFSSKPRDSEKRTNVWLGDSGACRRSSRQGDGS
jgi:hypothetical protein